ETQRRSEKAVQTPAELGYSFPAEWAPHAATWFSWPRPEGISFPDKYHTVPENLARIFREIAPRERVCINVPNGNYQRIVSQQLKEYGCPLRNIHFFHIKTNESWCRDHGPAFVVKPRRQGGASGAIVDWGFNAWGGKYPPYDDDDAVPTHIGEMLKLRVFNPGIVMEGGAVDFNGAGTILTTTSCLLNKNRNPDLKKSQIERYLRDFYGQKHICWLGDGIAGDDTDGHVDDLARFINPTTIVTAVENDAKDENFQVLRDNRKRLEKLRDQDGRPFEIVEIPMPHPVVHDGQRLPATYVNFYFVNGALLVPTYRDRRNDRKALQILQQHLPRHKVIGIDCVELIWGLGAIHCLSQQQPKFAVSWPADLKPTPLSP
ncbi:MAG TPA: agmatine deiminase family protein, partial [Tepidisphaeraceae bacterium]|nr:agmatine deiminase family protein [Tepidisphaeraceae bacterium]